MLMFRKLLSPDARRGQGLLEYGLVATFVLLVVAAAALLLIAALFGAFALGVGPIPHGFRYLHRVL